MSLVSPAALLNQYAIGDKNISETEISDLFKQSILPEMAEPLSTVPRSLALSAASPVP
jgi:hypothetical protein